MHGKRCYFWFADQPKHQIDSVLEASKGLFDGKKDGELAQMLVCRGKLLAVGVCTLASQCLSLRNDMQHASKGAIGSSGFHKIKGCKDDLLFLNCADIRLGMQKKRQPFRAASTTFYGMLDQFVLVTFTTLKKLPQRTWAL